MSSQNVHLFIWKSISLMYFSDFPTELHNQIWLVCAAEFDAAVVSELCGLRQQCELAPILLKRDWENGLVHDTCDVRCRFGVGVHVAPAEIPRDDYILNNRIYTSFPTGAGVFDLSPIDWHRTGPFIYLLIHSFSYSPTF